MSWSEVHFGAESWTIMFSAGARSTVSEFSTSLFCSSSCPCWFSLPLPCMNLIVGSKVFVLCFLQLLLMYSRSLDRFMRGFAQAQGCVEGIL